LTTLRKKHIAVNGHTIRFEFTGKSGKHWQLAVSDRRIASVVKRCADIPGYDLFQYLDDNGERRQVGSADVNEYLQSISGDNFTAKDFRTWAGTVLAATALSTCGCECEVQARKSIVAAAKQVARRLGNTPAICRKSYIYPEVLVAYVGRDLEKLAAQQPDAVFRREHAELSDEECSVLAFLQQRVGRAS
jgi:DNA topoisomerase-1